MSKAIAVRITKFVLGVLLLVPAVVGVVLGFATMPSLLSFAIILFSLALGVSIPGVIIYEAIVGRDILHLAPPEARIHDFLANQNSATHPFGLNNPANPASPLNPDHPARNL